MAERVLRIKFHPLQGNRILGEKSAAQLPMGIFPLKISKKQWLPIRFDKISVLAESRPATGKTFFSGN
jgi:hypothetical protein